MLQWVLHSLVLAQSELEWAEKCGCLDWKRQQCNIILFLGHAFARGHEDRGGKYSSCASSSSFLCLSSEDTYRAVSSCYPEIWAFTPRAI